MTILSEQTLVCGGEYFSSVHDSNLHILCRLSPMCHEQYSPWEATSTALVASWSHWSSWLTYWLQLQSGFHHSLALVEVLGERQQKESGDCCAPLQLLFFSAVFVQGAWATWSWPGTYFYTTKKKSPEVLLPGCLLEAPGIGVMAAVGQGSHAPAALGRGALAAWMPPGAGTALQPASGNAKRPGDQIFGKLRADNTFLRWS